MKIVINRQWGGFHIPKCLVSLIKKKNLWQYDKQVRTLPELIKWVENNDDGTGYAIPDEYSALKIINIPDESTDWMVQDYDGMETLFYVENGKIYEAK